MDISVRDKGLDALYPELKRIGYCGVDINFPSWDLREEILSAAFEEQMTQKHKRILSAGLKVCQTHLSCYPGHLPPLGDGSYRAFEEYMLPIIIKELELTSMMGCPTAVLHLYFEKAREQSRECNIRLIEQLLPILEKCGVVLAIENIYGPKRGDVHLTTAEDLLFYTDHFQSPYLGVCLDTGHAVTRRQDPIEMVKGLGGALRALHVHSNVPEQDLHLPPCFVRNVDWQNFCTALREVGYRGVFNMEIAAPKQMNRRTALSYYEMAFGIADSLVRNDVKSWMDE